MQCPITDASLIAAVLFTNSNDMLTFKVKEVYKLVSDVALMLLNCLGSKLLQKSRYAVSFMKLVQARLGKGKSHLGWRERGPRDHCYVGCIPVSSDCCTETLKTVKPWKTNKCSWPFILHC